MDDSKPALLPAIEVDGDYFGDPTRLPAPDDQRHPLLLQKPFGIANCGADPARATALGIDASAPARP
ncbi:MAG: hypothetical protein KDH15_10815 [Rhodocyclaceae bacterium]|nr:hypothetical protein [Rhodocyclaceae bacterium]